MIRLAALALLAFTPALLAAPVPKEARKAEGIEGLWKLESVSSQGVAVPLGADDPHWSIDARGNMIMHAGPVPHARASSSIRLVTDPVEKTLDYRYTQIVDTVYPGVYALTGDTLAICYNQYGSVPRLRPAAVEAGSDVNIWTLKRVR